MSESEKLLDGYQSVVNEGGQVEPRVYKRRWYILALFSALGLLLGACSNPYGNIANATERTFCWTDADIALSSSWQSIAFLVSVAFFTWLLDSKGLRASCVLSAFLMAAGSSIRCISVTPPLSNWLQHSGTLLVGLASPVVYSAPSLISGCWFPVEQRTTSTAIGITFNALGSAFIVLLGPALVHVHEANGTSPMTTASPHSNSSADVPLADWCSRKAGEPIYGQEHPHNHTLPPHIALMRHEMAIYLYIQFALCGFLFVLMLVYFPARPPTPPSVSASTRRSNFKPGIKRLIRNGRFWILALVYSATNGLYTTYAGVLDVVLKSAGVPDDQRVSGYLVCIAVLGLAVLGLVIARVADYCTRYLKLMIIALCVSSASFMLWFTLILEGYLSRNMVWVYLSFVCGAVLINSAVPLFYEMACECTFPVGEGLTNGFLNVINNLLSLVFLLVLMLPNIGTSWMNWCLVGSSLVCVPIMIPFNQRHGRLDMDAIITNVTEEEAADGAPSCHHGNKNDAAIETNE